MWLDKKQVYIVTDSYGAVRVDMAVTIEIQFAHRTSPIVMVWIQIRATLFRCCDLYRQYGNQHHYNLRRALRSFQDQGKAKSIFPSACRSHVISFDLPKITAIPIAIDIT